MTDDGSILFERRAEIAFPNASTTKMVTALLVERSVPLSDEVRISEAAASVGEGGEDLEPGERFTVEELLYALLLTSSNDAAVALAEHVAGSEQAFVDEMNDLAGEIGATATHFVTPHGLDRPGHVASAQDLALIAEHLLQEPVLAQMVRTASITIPGPDGPMLLENRNLLLGTYRGAIGIKTGFTDDAGNVLVSSAERRGRRLIAVVMHSEDSFRDSRILLDRGWKVLSRTVLLEAGQPVASAVLDPTGGVAIVAGETVKGIGDPDEVRLTFVPPDSGVGGTIEVFVAGKVVATVPAEADIPPAAQASSGGIFAGLLRLAARVTGKIDW